MSAQRSPKRLARLLHVRTLQLGMSQAEQAAANAKLMSEAELKRRIAQLAENVTPRHADEGFAQTFAAAAYYRERLQASALAAEQRVVAAQAGVRRAEDATREARRDQSAIEKLIERAEADAAIRAIRALEVQPPARRNRHAPC